MSQAQTVADGVALADNQNITLAHHKTFRLYHSGTHSFIDDAGTGNLYIRSSDMRLKIYWRNMIVATADANVTFAMTILPNSHHHTASNQRVCCETQTTTKSGTPSANFDNYQNFVWTLTGNITLINPTTENWSNRFLHIYPQRCGSDCITR